MMGPLDLEIKVLEGRVPEFTSYEDAGLDLYSAEDITIKYGTWEVIRLGIASAFASNYACLFRDRSSLAGKGLHVMGGVIDSSYRGEWKVMLYNLSNHNYYVKFGQKIVQAIFVPCYHLLSLLFQ